MAIIKRVNKNGNYSYQVKVKGSDGTWVTETFSRRVDAERCESELKLRRGNGSAVSRLNRALTVSEFFREWDEHTRNNGVSAGWRVSQTQMFRDYVEPQIGSIRLARITPAQISKVLSRVSEMGRSAQTRKHVYGVLRQLFGDAVTLFHVLEENPVLTTLRPKLPKKEADYLTRSEVTKLLQHVSGKPYEVAIWLGVLAGRRVGEIQALTWDNVDLTRGVIHIRGTYVRKEKRFQDYPKGKRWHSIKMPAELWAVLTCQKEEASSRYVVPSKNGNFLSYDTYYKALHRYCREAGVKEISTHGLRHSCSGVYMDFGASRDDIRILFAHSDSSVTDAYIHDDGSRLGGVADVIRLFPEEESSGVVSQKFPIHEMELENGKMAEVDSM